LCARHYSPIFIVAYVDKKLLELETI